MCINHPDRPRFRNYRTCKECRREIDKTQIHREYIPIEYINKEDIIHDAKLGFTIQQLLKRYSYSRGRIERICKEEGIEIYKSKDSKTAKIEKSEGSYPFLPDMLEYVGTIRPHYSWERI
jgi:hypothetical protein